ncbi:unnamed protein product [marine sediment metagenome]|uniref:Uncharacterized protein n=1 Tax=marine sediment metagenome TaxID=412755 RepID=X1GKR2_9ZZZZ
MIGRRLLSSTESWFNISIAIGTILSATLPPILFYIEYIFSLSHYVFVTSAVGIQGGYGSNYDTRPDTDIPEINNLNADYAKVNTIIFVGAWFWLITLLENMKILYSTFWILFLSSIYSNYVPTSVIWFIAMIFITIIELIKVIIYLISAAYMSINKSWFWIGYAPGLEKNNPTIEFIVLIIIDIITLIYGIIACITMAVSYNLKSKIVQTKMQIGVASEVGIANKIGSNIKIDGDDDKSDFRYTNSFLKYNKRKIV